jgi:hypothetical protein
VHPAVSDFCSGVYYVCCLYGPEIPEQTPPELKSLMISAEGLETAVRTWLADLGQTR